MEKQILKVAGVGFDHMHIGDQLAAAQEADGFEVVAVYDNNQKRMAEVCNDLSIPAEVQYTDWQAMFDHHQIDVAIVCSTTAEHLQWVEILAKAGIHIVLEKPFAVTYQEAQAAINFASSANVTLAINWPLAWYDSHRTANRIIKDGQIGKVIEVHYYDGNRGPQYHLHAKKEVKEPVDIQDSWWFKKQDGGGSLLDYLGYGGTLATWFRNGELPEEINASAFVPPGFEVDIQSIVIARYKSGLSSFQTRWGTFSDPWVHQPQPFCGFVIVGEQGTICSRDYAKHVTLQTADSPQCKDVPVDDFSHEPNIFYQLHRCITENKTFEGPCSPAISLGGQQIVDAAYQSCLSKQYVSIES